MSYIVVQIMGDSFLPVFETYNEESALVAREAAQNASQYDTIIIYGDKYDAKYIDVLIKRGALSE